MNGHTNGKTSPDVSINLVSVQQAILEQQEDGRDEISDKIDSIVFQKRSDREAQYQPSLARAPTTKDDLRYNMKHPKRGKAIILNNKEFSPALGLRPRNGTDVDRDKLFLKLRELDFDVYCYNDLTLGEIEAVLKSLAKEDHSDRDTLMITVLSHGEAGIMFAKDTCYKPEILWSSFTADRCPTLAGKPKLFFIQACQGDRLDSGTLLAHSRGITETDSGSFNYKIPSHADFLICYSTIPGFFSWRNTTNGSWFVQALCKVLGERYRSTHLLDMMTIVNQIVAFDYESNCPGDAVMHQKKQIPCITSLLTRQVYFEPK